MCSCLSMCLMTFSLALRYTHANAAEGLFPCVRWPHRIASRRRVSPKACVCRNDGNKPLRPFSWQPYVGILVGDPDRDIEAFFAAPLNGKQQAHPVRQFPYLCRLVGAHIAADAGDAVGCSISWTSG